MSVTHSKYYHTENTTYTVPADINIERWNATMQEWSVVTTTKRATYTESESHLSHREKKIEFTLPPSAYPYTMIRVSRWWLEILTPIEGVGMARKGVGEP